MSRILCLLAIAACGGGSSTSDGSTDAALVMQTVGGTATERMGLNASPVSGVAVAIYARADEQTALAMTSTDAAGKFTLTYSAAATAEIVVEAKKTGYVASYFYPAGPIGTTPGTAPIDMMTTASHTALYMGTTADPAKGTVELTIISSNSTVAGATVATQPAAGSYKYNDAGGQPNPSATSTALDGIGFALNVPAGMVTINATKGGIMLKMPKFVVHTGSLNQAIVTP